MPSASEDPMLLDRFAMEPYLKRERRWLEGEMASKEWKGATNRVAFAHIPPVGGNSKEYRNINAYLYGPLEKNLTLLMAGHVHDGRYYKSGGMAKFPVLTGGGPYKTRGTKGNHMATLSVLSVKGASLEVYQIGLDGKENFREKV
jgi:hypothetical protein